MRILFAFSLILLAPLAFAQQDAPRAAKRIVCPTCKGEGKVLNPNHDPQRMGRAFDKMMRCPLCKGKKTVSPEQLKPRRPVGPRPVVCRRCNGEGKIPNPNFDPHRIGRAFDRMTTCPVCQGYKKAVLPPLPPLPKPTREDKALERLERIPDVVDDWDGGVAKTSYRLIQAYSDRRGLFEPRQVWTYQWLGRKRRNARHETMRAEKKLPRIVVDGFDLSDCVGCETMEATATAYRIGVFADPQTGVRYKLYTIDRNRALRRVRKLAQEDQSGSDESDERNASDEVEDSSSRRKSRRPAKADAEPLDDSSDGREEDSSDGWEDAAEESSPSSSSRRKSRRSAKADAEPLDESSDGWEEDASDDWEDAAEEPDSPPRPRG